MRPVFRIFLYGLLLAACVNAPHGPSEAEQSAFGQYVYRIDTAQMEQQFHLLTDADTSHWGADKAVRHCYDSLAHLDQLPRWFTRMGVDADAFDMLEFLRREVPRAGLDSSAFFIAEIAHDLDIVGQLASDSLAEDINQLLPRLSYNLSRAYVRYAAGQRYGFMRPARLFNHHTMRASGEGYARLFDYEVKAPNYHEATAMLFSDDRMDYLRRSEPANPLYRTLQQLLADTAAAAHRHTLAVNMERCRWQMPLPPTNGRRIIVNLPAQQLWAICPDSVLDMRICLGATTTKTPLLHSEITHMQINPDWIITPNIIKNEVARHGGDSAYFARHRYYITDRSTGDTLNPARVTADQLRSGRLRVGQHGGPGNSLGRIVFRFPNDFSVYLHDTNNRSAFQRQRRTLSHGCVRVQKPLELALFLLPEADEWTADRLRISMDIPPTTDRGRQYLQEHADDALPHRLIAYHGVNPHVPVFFIYHTAYPNPDSGLMEYFPDVYGYDQVISRNVPLIH